MQAPQNNLRGGFFVRLSAYLIDMLVLGAVLLVVRLPLFFFKLGAPDFFLFTPLLFQFSAVDILLYLASCAYFVILTYRTGATVGKRLMSLQVTTMTGEPLTLLNIIYRETIGRYLSSLLLIGYIMVGVSNERRGLHDILSDTQVLYALPNATDMDAPQQDSQTPQQDSQTSPEDPDTGWNMPETPRGEFI